MDAQTLLGAVRLAGAHKAAHVLIGGVVFDPAFRGLCESNACGNFGLCHMCPPAVGDIHALIAEAKRYGEAVLYQTVSPLEDSFDIEGMLHAGKEHNACALRVRALLEGERGLLHLGSGGCRACERCSARDGLPCLKPAEAMASLEAYGIDVLQTSRNAGLRYSNGPDTVTYFGLVLFGRRSDA